MRLVRGLQTVICVLKNAVFGTQFPMCGQLETHPRPTGDCEVVPSSQHDNLKKADSY